MHTHSIAELISGGEAEAPYLAFRPSGRKSYGFDLLDSLIQIDPAGLELHIQCGPEIAPHLSLQPDEMLVRILEISLLNQKMFRITGPPLVKKG